MARTEHFIGLEWLRFLLAIYVVLFHTVHAYVEDGPTWLSELAGVGFFATGPSAKGRSRSTVKKAARAGARYALLVGPGEEERGTVTVRNMETGEQTEVPREAAAETIAQA